MFSGNEICTYNNDYQKVEKMEPHVQTADRDTTFGGEDINYRTLEYRIARLESRHLPSLLTSREHDPAPKKFTTAKINFIDNRFDSAKGKRVDQEVEDFFEDDTPSHSNPITAKRVFREDNMGVEKTDIIIEGLGLRKLLQSVLSTYLQHEFKNTFEKPAITLSKPFIPLEYNWKELQAATTSSEILQEHGKESVEDLNTLLNLVYRLAPKYVDTRKNVKTSKTIQKNYLHCIFRPGSLVVATFRDRHTQLMKVHHFGAGSTANHNDTSSVFCEGYDWNGKTLDRVRYEFPMPKMATEELFPLRDLPCYPLEMYEDMDGLNKADELKQTLIKRGQKFEKLCNSQHQGGNKYMYKGQFQVEGDLRSGLLSNHPPRSGTLHNDLYTFLSRSYIRDGNTQAHLAVRFPIHEVMLL